MDKIEFWKVVTVTDDNECHIDNFGIESNAKEEYERRVELKNKNRHIDHVFMAKVDATTETEVQYSFRDCSEWFQIKNEMEEAGLEIGKTYWFANGGNVYKCEYKGMKANVHGTMCHIVQTVGGIQTAEYLIIPQFKHCIKKTYDEASRTASEFLRKRYEEEKE